MELNAPVPGFNQLMLEKAFKRCVRLLLTVCPAEDFRKAFPSFTAAEQQCLHPPFIQEDVESLFLDTQVGACLDTVEELVEEHNLDRELLAEKNDVEEAAQSCLEAENNELSYLMRLLAKAEEMKNRISEHLDLLKKEKLDFSCAVNLAQEIHTWIRDRNQY